MIINKNKLLDLRSGHSDNAECAIMTAICFMADLEPRGMTKGLAPEYDFQINNTKVELKISSKGAKGSIELCKEDYRAGGLSATESDVYAFLNPLINKGKGRAKLRLIQTWQLKAWYNVDRNETWDTDPIGDRGGSILAPFDFKNFDDLYIADCECEWTKDGLVFDTSTFKPNSYGMNKIREYIK